MRSAAIATARPAARPEQAARSDKHDDGDRCSCLYLQFPSNVR
jgi:hypothetical protein